MKYFNKSILQIPTLLWLLLFSVGVAAQNASVKGKLTESSTATPLAYASVRLYQMPEKKLAGGALTDEKGLFNIALTLGVFTAEIEIIGFETIKTPQFSRTKEHPNHHLGT